MGAWGFSPHHAPHPHPRQPPQPLPRKKPSQFHRRSPPGHQPGHNAAGPHPDISPVTTPPSPSPESSPPQPHRRLPPRVSGTAPERIGSPCSDFPSRLTPFELHQPSTQARYGAKGLPILSGAATRQSHQTRPPNKATKKKREATEEIAIRACDRIRRPSWVAHSPWKFVQ